jgi:hypothetical protein
LLIINCKRFRLASAMTQERCISGLDRLLVTLRGLDRMAEPELPEPVVVVEHRPEPVFGGREGIGDHLGYRPGARTNPLERLN